MYQIRFVLGRKVFVEKCLKICLSPPQMAGAPGMRLSSKTLDAPLMALGMASINNVFVIVIFDGFWTGLKVDFLKQTFRDSPRL